MASRSALAFALTSFLLTACGGSSPPPQTGPGYVPQGSSGPLFYRLPFNGTWRVARTHYDLKNDQGFGLDLVVDAPMPRSGRNEDHPSYNQPVVADAAGVVVVAVDGVPENVPGVVNVYDAHGNFVVIDHRNGEFSLFAHMIPGSCKL